MNQHLWEFQEKKLAGCISREVALKLSQVTESEIICPVLYRVADARYTKIAGEMPLLVIDGCGTRCASKLASEKHLKVVDILKEHRGAKPGTATKLTEEGWQIVDELAQSIAEKVKLVAEEE